MKLIKKNCKRWKIRSWYPISKSQNSPQREQNRRRPNRVWKIRQNTWRGIRGHRVHCINLFCSISPRTHMRVGFPIKTWSRSFQIWIVILILVQTWLHKNVGSSINSCLPTIQILCALINVCSNWLEDSMKFDWMKHWFMLANYPDFFPLSLRSSFIHWS